MGGTTPAGSGKAAETREKCGQQFQPSFFNNNEQRTIMQNKANF